MEHRANVLDVVRAITLVASDHPEVVVWWYVPRLLDNPNIEILVELEPGSKPDLARIARQVEAQLNKVTVTVSVHAGANENRRLFRVVSKRTARQQPA